MSTVTCVDTRLAGSRHRLCLVTRPRCSLAVMPKRLSPHLGYVFLEHGPATSGTILFHAKTRARVVLAEPVGSWRLEFFEDGFGAVLDESTDEAVLVAELLAVAMYEDSDTGEVWFACDDGRQPGRWKFPVHDRHQLRTAHVRPGPTQATLLLHIAVFMVPRMLCLVFWDLLQLYKAAGFVAGKGPRGLPRWEQRFASCGIPGVLLRSRRPQDGVDHADLASSTCRILPFPTVDTVGLVALLSAWANPAKGSSGMRRVDDRYACEAILQGLCLSLEGG